MYFIRLDRFFVLFTIFIIADRNVRVVGFHFFTDLIVFGDDYSDTGNTFNQTNQQYPPSPPYYFGRSTNGPLWIEQLGFKNIQNFALNGATLDNDRSVQSSVSSDEVFVNNIRQQIVEYLKTNDLTTVDLSRTLYIIWAGANDFFNNPNITAMNVVKTLMNTLSDLLVAQVPYIIVMNQPPLDLYPIVKRSTHYVDLAARIVDYNRYLSSNISSMDNFYEKVSIRVFDIYTLINSLFITNTSEQWISSSPCWSMTNSNIVISSCSNPDQYVFIDDSHLTTKIHQLIGKNFQEFLISTSIRLGPSLSIFLLINFLLCLRILE